MKTRHVVFVVITVLVMSCLSVAAPEKQDELYSDFRTFSRIVATIKAAYAEKVDDKKLFQGAYNGMLQTLDPYSMYLPPEEKAELEVETRGEFGGLGIEVSTDKNGVLMVISPIEGSPAFKAGVLAGDRIVRIEGKTTKGLTTNDAVKRLRGLKGTPVTITVVHEDGKIQDITIVRDVIRLESIRAVRFVDDRHKIAYLRFTQFQANSAESLDKAVKELQAQGMKALIIDVRYNPGGLLNAAIDICDRFISDGVIVSTRGLHSPEHVARATGRNTYPDLPIAILVSGRTASAAEILSGCIQDHKRGVIVGMRTFGKGSVQSLIQLDDGAALRLTTAHYYTPSGRLIHRDWNDTNQKVWGIDPDIEVKTVLQDEVDLWEHWRNEELKKVEDQKLKNGKGVNNKDTTQPAASDEDIRELVPLAEPSAKPEAGKDGEKEAPKEFHDRALEAAINAMTGEIIQREREAAEKPAAQPAAK